MKWTSFKNRYDHATEEGWVYVGMESPTLFRDSAKATKQDAKCTYEYVKEYILLQVSIGFRRSLQTLSEKPRMFLWANT